MFKKNIYKTNSDLPFRINRTKIDLFFDCKRCFFLDQKHGIRRPHGTPLVLNNKIVDDFKKELNECRIKQKVHPEIMKLKKQFIPLFHSKLDDWRSSFKGARFLHNTTNLVLSGIIDDIWTNPLTQLNHAIIIKSTSKSEKINIDNIWHGYWRQLSLYSFLLNKNTLQMSKTGIFLYINAKSDSDHKIIFNLNYFEKILDYNWIEPTISEIYKTLNDNKIPEKKYNCKFCNYYSNIKRIDE